MSKAQGQFTIVDYNDALTLTGYIGSNLAKSRLSEVFLDRDAITASLNRLLILPLLTWAVLRLFPISNPVVFGLSVIIMAMPAPAIASILAEQYDSGKELASRTVFLSSLLSMATIPLIALLL